MVIVLMGVSGSGKTTVGKILAADLGWTFIEGDDFHPTENIEKMRGGTPLSDEDRRPWFQALQSRVEKACERNEDVILACSALKDDYRDFLEQQDPECVHFVCLTGSEDLIRHRLEQRRGHFIDPALLRSQLETLESPEGSLKVDITPAPKAIASEIRRQLNL
ncbi:MAG: gluconokinase [Planctomycetota bacterium]|nr:gluconokinase [Planctomycetaceae bacterium]MDQ3329197.1 gluconokinase [Planctomycetota bacterium]